MNSMERMTRCLQHEEADRVPVYPVLGGCVRHLVGASYKEWSTNAEVCANGFIKARELTGCDSIVTLIDLSVECSAWGQELQFNETCSRRKRAPAAYFIIRSDQEKYKVSKAFTFSRFRTSL